MKHTDSNQIEDNATKLRFKKWWIASAFLFGAVGIVFLMKYEAKEEELPPKKIKKEEIFVSQKVRQGDRILDTIQDLIISREKVAPEKKTEAKTSTKEIEASGSPNNEPENKLTSKKGENSKPLKEKSTTTIKQEVVVKKDSLTNMKNPEKLDVGDPCITTVIKAKPMISPACEGERNGGFYLDVEAVSGGKSPYHYSFDGAKVRLVTQNGIKYDNLAAGNYMLVLADADSCMGSVVIVVNEKVCMEERQFSFNPTKKSLRITLQHSDDGVVEIRSETGMRVFKQEVQTAFEWDGRDDDGNEVASGIYHFVVRYSNGIQEHGFITVIY